MVAGERGLAVDIGFLLLGLAAGAVGAGDPPSVGSAVAQYNQRLAAQPGLEVSTAAPADYYSPDGGGVPAWLDGLGLGEHELRAVAAVVGAYAHSADPPEPRRQPSVAEAIAWTGLAMVADNASRRSGSSAAGIHDRSAAPRVPFPAAPLPPPKDLVPGRLLAMETCGGAFFSALTRLNQSYPKAPFTRFVRLVGASAFAGPLRADPTCAAAAE